MHPIFLKLHDIPQPSALQPQEIMLRSVWNNWAVSLNWSQDVFQFPSPSCWLQRPPHPFLNSEICSKGMLLGCSTCWRQSCQLERWRKWRFPDYLLVGNVAEFVQWCTTGCTIVLQEETFTCYLYLLMCAFCIDECVERCEQVLYTVLYNPPINIGRDRIVNEWGWGLVFEGCGGTVLSKFKYSHRMKVWGRPTCSVG